MTALDLPDCPILVSVVREHQTAFLLVWNGNWGGAV